VSAGWAELLVELRAATRNISDMIMGALVEYG
jgi:hypothetical protein